MISIEFGPDQQDGAAKLAEAHPDQVNCVKSRNPFGGSDLTLVVSIAGLAIPAIRAVLVEHIRSKRFKSFTYRGTKIVGHSAKDIETIIDKLNEAGPPASS